MELIVAKNALPKNVKVCKKSKKFIAPLKASQKVIDEISNSQTSESNQSLRQISQSQTEAFKTNQALIKTQNEASTSQTSDLLLTQMELSQMNLHLNQNFKPDNQNSLCTGQYMSQKNINQGFSNVAEANPITMEYHDQLQSYDTFHQTLDCLQPFNPIDALIPSVVTTAHYQDSLCHNRAINMENYETYQPRNSKKSFSLGGILLGSLNLLNDDDIDLEIQTQESEKSSVKMLSRNQSKCSVVSLKKYKNLDHNSNENLPNMIPKEKDLCMLFKSNPKSNKVKVPMDIMLGDIGFNRQYCDYIKNVGYHDKVDAEANKSYELMLKMYENKNRKLIDVRKKRKIK